RGQLQSLADALGESAEKLVSDVRSSGGVEGAAARATGGEAATVPSPSVVDDLPEPEPVGRPEPVIPPEPAETEAVAEAEPAEAAAPEGGEDPARPPEAPDIVKLERHEPPAPEPAPDRRESDQHLSARLVALQMAVAG